MNLFAWILFGLITGVIANLIDPRPSSGGLLAAIVLGIVGALVGGFLASVLFGVGITGFNLESFAIAVGGALLLLVGERALRRSA